ncbi:hypothetical protein CIB84_000590 [Bambusicola thoracicus]|uniref:EF-hand domain-containing protein n=1 Tax=Bambusicola thoracicus TaxID=9083 RepID=A0A2P4TH16_BAMTH|nr:hypothetical protein CIB84_000590 [Bambusicola thoracicus]
MSVGKRSAAGRGVLVLTGPCGGVRARPGREERGSVELAAVQSQRGLLFPAKLMVNFEASLPRGIRAMAATYRLMVTTVNCYSSVVIEQHFQHTVHYCTGTCQVFKQGVACIVAHHSVCAELSVQDANLDHKIPVFENGLALPGNEDYQQILLNNPRIKKGSLVQASSSLKDITGEAINLASGKIKEFSFEKLKNSSNHVAYRKGRKVRSESFSRRSFDFDMIYGHFSNGENSPPCGFLQCPSAAEKWQESSDAPEVSMNPMVPFSPHSFSEENFITQILEKHKLDGSSGGDIKVCLDILLKCSEDLKKCTDIIKHCIKKKSADSVSGGNSSDPLASSEMIYMNLMRRFSSYLKKLPFEFKTPGHKEASDLGELVNCFHGLQQTPFSPIFGDEQPPRYEDIIQLPSSNAVPVRLPGDQCEVTSPSPSIQTSTVSFTSNSLCSISQENSVRAVKDACVLPQLPATSPSDCTSSTEVLYIEEESDGERLLEKTKRAKEKGDWESLKHSYQIPGSSDVIADVKTEPMRVGGELSRTSEKSNLLKPVSDSVLRGSEAAVSKGEQTCNINKDEIDKLLLDLEHFSQKMESTCREPPPKESEPACLQVFGWQGRPVLPVALEPKSKPIDPTYPLSKIMETNGHKMEEDDRALLLRILGSIEDFAQELVEFQTGKGSLSKEKEVMQILQETLSTPSQSLLGAQKSYAGAASRDTVPPLIQQAPEVIKTRCSPSVSNFSLCIFAYGNGKHDLVGYLQQAKRASSSKRVLGKVKGLPNVCTNHEEIIARIEEAFTEFQDEKANICEMGKIAKICGCPLYWKAPMFSASGGQRTGCVSVHSFVSLWRKILCSCHDDASRFASLVAKPSCGYLEQEDFIPLLQDVVETHPGLTFLKDAPEFHSRYITTRQAPETDEEDAEYHETFNVTSSRVCKESLVLAMCAVKKPRQLKTTYQNLLLVEKCLGYTVIQRIFYTVNRSWSGKITLTELRKSNFLQTLALLEEEDDINQITDYFSYEHFYVIYCKFWELDTDHDLYISQKDLARYSDQALSSRIIERIFSGAVDFENDGPEPSDWDRYAAEEYEILVAEESGNEQLQEGSFEEDYETDEVLPPSETGDKSN